MIPIIASQARHGSGFDARNVLTFRVSTRGPRTQQGAQRAEFFRKVLEGIAAVPGVESAGAALGLPFFGFGSTPVTLDAGPRPEPGSELRTLALSATPGYFETMRMPLLRGRGITEQDTADTPRIAVVGQTLARQLWGERDPLGESLTLHDSALRPRTASSASSETCAAPGSLPSPIPPSTCRWLSCLRPSAWASSCGPRRAAPRSPSPSR